MIISEEEYNRAKTILLHIYDYGEPEGQAALDSFYNEIRKLEYDIEYYEEKYKK